MVYDCTIASTIAALCNCFDNEIGKQVQLPPADVFSKIVAESIMTSQRFLKRSRENGEKNANNQKNFKNESLLAWSKQLKMVYSFLFMRSSLLRCVESF